MISVPPESLSDPLHAVVALGSNLGDSIATVLRAMDCLQQLSDQPLLRSSLWRTEPIDCPPGSPSFINAVVAFVPRPEETPESLLARLQDLERQFGRRPKAVLNEARPLDLDLIMFGARIRATPTLTLPHPRAHQRRFVLAPLAELEPELRLPGHDRAVRGLLDDLGSAQPIVRVAT